MWHTVAVHYNYHSLRQFIQNWNKCVYDWITESESFTILICLGMKQYSCVLHRDMVDSTVDSFGTIFTADAKVI